MATLNLFSLLDWFHPPRPKDTLVPVRGERPLEAMICSRDRALEERLTAALEERGYTVVTQRNPWTVRIAVRRSWPDLAVIDWRIGQQSAAKLAATLNRSEETHMCSILAMVSAEDQQSLPEILQLGVNAVCVWFPLWFSKAVLTC